MCTLSFKRIEFRRVNVQNCDERMHVNSPSHFNKVTASVKLTITEFIQTCGV